MEKKNNYMVQTEDTRISVCMAIYNGETHLHAQIESILKQLNQDDELIICDDHSTDQSIEIIEKFKEDNRIVLLVNNKRLGIIKNFECAMSKARGKYIFLSDQDDVWLDGKVNKCVEALNSNLLVLTDCIVVDENLSPILNSFFKFNQSKNGFINNLIKNSYMGCCMAFKRELLDTALPIPKNIPMHDVWLGLLAELKGNICFLDEPLILYRRHDNNTALLKSGFSFIKKVKMRIILLICLLIRVVMIKLEKLKHGQ